MKDIHARRPVNRQASQVVGLGEHYEPDFKKANIHDSDLPILTSPVPDKVENLIGKRSGRLTVVGYHGARVKKSGEVVNHRWVVKCDCGMWTVRKSRAIKSPRTEDDACDKCCHFRSVKYKYSSLIINR